MCCHCVVATLVILVAFLPLTRTQNDLDTVWVSLDQGSDFNPCSSDLPCLTLTRALLLASRLPSSTQPPQVFLASSQQSYPCENTPSGVLVAVDVSIIAPSPGVVFDCQSQGSAFHISAGVSVTISNLELRNGWSSSGGAIYSRAAHLSLLNCLFVFNSATPKDTDAFDIASGGGAVFQADGELAVQDCTFDSNTALIAGAAILFVQSPESGLFPLFIQSSAFYQNVVSPGGNHRMAGAVGFFVYGNSMLDVIDCQFVNNRLQNGVNISLGGAIGAHVHEASYGLFRVSDSVFEGNNLELGPSGIFAAGAGFAVGGENSSSFSVVISGCIFDGNTLTYPASSQANGGGAAVSLQYSPSCVDCSLHFSNSTVMNNQFYGNCNVSLGCGGIVSVGAEENDGCSETFVESVFSNNTLHGSGVSAVAVTARQLRRNSATIVTGCVFSDNVFLNILEGVAGGLSTTSFRLCLNCSFIVTDSNFTKNSILALNDVNLAAALSTNHAKSSRHCSIVVRGCFFIGNSNRGLGAGLVVSFLSFDVSPHTFTDCDAPLDWEGHFCNSVLITDCTYEENKAQGSSGSPSLGGGVAVLYGNTYVLNVTLRDSYFARNSLSGNGSLAGGFALAASYTGLLNFHEPRVSLLAAVVERTTFIGNSVEGAGAVGGAACLLLPFDVATNVDSMLEPPQWVRNNSIVLSDCTFVNNSAANGGSGGAVAMSNGLAAVLNCEFVGNQAALGAGGLKTLPGSQQLFMQGCTFAHNGAEESDSSAGPLLWLSSGAISISNSSFQMLSNTFEFEFEIAVCAGVTFGPDVTLACPTGNKLVLYGGQTVLQFLQGFQHRMTETAVYITCAPCSRNNYSLEPSTAVGTGTALLDVHETKCLPCPVGGNCSKGAAAITAVPGYWSYSSVGAGINSNRSQMFFVRCPPNYCCTQGDVCHDRRGCMPHRGGALCSECDDGYTESFGQTACIPNELCEHNWYWWALLVQCGFLFVLWAVFSQQATITGQYKVLFYFYQILPLVTTVDAFALLATMVSLFSLRLNSVGVSGSTSWYSVCLFPDVSALTKEIFVLVLPPILTCQLAFVAVVHFVVVRVKLARTGVAKPWTGRYWAAFTNLLLLNYSGNVATVGRLLYCQDMHDISVLWISGNLQCYTSFQIWLLLYATLLPLFPFLLMFAKRRFRLPQECLTLLEGAYRAGCQDWESDILLRRFAMAVVYTSLANRLLVRQLVMCLLCLLCLASHLWYKPFRVPRVQLAESVSLALLCVLSAAELVFVTGYEVTTVGQSVVMELAQQEFARPNSYLEATSAGVVYAVGLLAIAPGAVAVAFFLYSWIKRARVWIKHRKARARPADLDFPLLEK